MDIPTTLIGALALGFALFTLALRVTNPAKLKKHERLQAVLGDKGGTIVHGVFYIGLPLAFGGFCLVSAFRGIALF